MLQEGSAMSSNGTGISTPRFQIVRPDEIQDVSTHAHAHTRTSDYMPSDQEVLNALIANDGVVARTAGKLGIDEVDVYSVVTKHARALSTRLRAVTMLTSYAALQQVQAAMLESLHEMPADAIGRTYAATLSAFSNLAAQFEEQETENEDEQDASTAKEMMLGKIARMIDTEQAIESAASNG